MDPAALMPHTLEDAAQGGDEAGVLVGDDQPDAVQATLFQGAEEPAPKHLVLGVADIQAEDLPATVGGDRGGDDDGHRGDLPAADRAAGSGAADMQVGGVEEHIRERGVVQRPVPERRDLLVQPGADPRHLRLRDAGPDPSAATRSSTARVETPFTQASITTAYRAWSIRRRRSKMTGKNDPCRSFGIRSSTSPAWVATSRGRDPFRSVTRLVAFVAAGADDLAGLGLDQFLHHQPDRFADQVHALPGTERLQQLGCDRLRQRHRWEPPDEYLPVHIENPADGALNAATHRTPKPHHARGLTRFEPARTCTQPAFQLRTSRVEERSRASVERQNQPPK